MTIIKTKKLTKIYGSGSTAVKALDGIDFEVKQGDFIAIMGPSGSGKSTLLHLMGALENPTSGTISLEGREYESLSDRQLTNIRRFNIGFVFQFFNLIPTLSVEENILMPIVIANKSPKKYREKMNEILNMVDLKDRNHHFIDQISGGEQQRVAIARALITEPAVILADEPTGNLDSANSLHVLKLLRQSSNELEQTVIMVTHDAKAAAFADKVLFLKDGHFVLQEDISKEQDKTGFIMKLLTKLNM